MVAQFSFKVMVQFRVDKGHFPLMIHHQFCIIKNHHQIKESLSLEENTKNTKINNLVSVKKRIGFHPLRLFYRYYSDYFRVPLFNYF